MKKTKIILLSSVLSLTSIAGIVAFSGKNNKVNADSIIPEGQVLDTIVDTISVSDLTFGGKTNQDRFTENKNTETTFTFSDENTNKNLIFKCKYDVVDANTSDSNAWRFHFDVADDKWNSDNSLWMRGDGTYFAYKKADNSFGWKKSAALTEGMHDIEYGRIAILENGVNTNNYYIYYKLDGELINETITDYDLSKMDGKMFVNFSSGNTSNTVYDINYGPVAYEDADVISISDLTIGNNPAGYSQTLDAHHTYTYEATATNKSVVYKFIYECLDQASVSCQFHFSNTWKMDGGLIWFRPDHTYIQKDDGKYVEAKASFTENGRYNVEIGKLLATSGINTGKYYIYVKVNDELIADYASSSMPDVAALFTTGTNGDILYDVNYKEAVYEDADVISIGDLKVNNAAIGNITKLDEHHTFDYTSTAAHKSVIYKFKYETLDPTTISCQFHFSNTWKMDGGLIWFRDDKTYIHKTDGKYIEKDASFPEVGTYNVELGKVYILDGIGKDNYYIYIKVNDVLIADYTLANMPDVASLFTTGTNGDILYDIDYVPCTDSHTLEHHDAVTGSCFGEGVIEYWKCTNCGKTFSDAEGKTEVTNLISPALGHDYSDVIYSWTQADGGYKCVGIATCSRDFNHVLTEEVVGSFEVITPATCSQVGSGKYTATFENEAFSTQEKIVEIPLVEHEFTKIEEVSPTYTQDGVKEHYVCESCKDLFILENGAYVKVEEEDLVIPHLEEIIEDSSAEAKSEDPSIEVESQDESIEVESEQASEIKESERPSDVKSDNTISTPASSNPATSEQVSPSEPNKKGCGGALATSGIISLLALAGAIILKRKEH